MAKPLTKITTEPDSNSQNHFLESYSLNLETKQFEWKKMKMTLHSNPSLLYIFIDMTDVCNREKNNSHKKYVEMLVATSTHELRTPLNSIKSSITFALPFANGEGV